MHLLLENTIGNRMNHLTCRGTSEVTEMLFLVTVLSYKISTIVLLDNTVYTNQ